MQSFSTGSKGHQKHLRGHLQTSLPLTHSLRISALLLQRLELNSDDLALGLFFCYCIPSFCLYNISIARIGHGHESWHRPVSFHCTYLPPTCSWPTRPTTIKTALAAPCAPSAFSPGNPLVLCFPQLVVGDRGMEALAPVEPELAKSLSKSRQKRGSAEPSPDSELYPNSDRPQFGLPLSSCGGPEESTAPGLLTASNVKTLLPTKAAGLNQEGVPCLPAQAPPPAAQLAPIVPPEKAWPGPQGTTGEGGHTYRHPAQALIG